MELRSAAYSSEIVSHRTERHPRRNWSQCLADCNGGRDAALVLGYRRHGVTMSALAQAAGLSVSRVIAMEERAAG